jgi:hypothetical protein
MEKNDIFAQVLTDIRQTIQLSEQKNRNYQQKKEREDFFTPKYSRFRLVIYMKNGKSCWYPSYDTQKRKESSFLDEQIGLSRLLAIVKDKAGQYKTAVIYATADEVPLWEGSDYTYPVVKYDYYGNMKVNKHVGFHKNTDGDLILDKVLLKMGVKTIKHLNEQK